MMIHEIWNNVECFSLETLVVPSLYDDSRNVEQWECCSFEMNDWCSDWYITILAMVAMFMYSLIEQCILTIIFFPTLYNKGIRSKTIWFKSKCLKIYPILALSSLIVVILKYLLKLNELYTSRYTIYKTSKSCIRKENLHQLICYVYVHYASLRFRFSLLLQYNIPHLFVDRWSASTIEIRR